MSRNFLNLSDIKIGQLKKILTRATYLKKLREKNKNYLSLKNINLAMIFEKPSTRTRVSFELAIKVYLKGYKIEHVALTIEGQRPRFQKRAKEIRTSVANIMKVSIDQVGISFTSGQELTVFGKGMGLMCCCILSVT